MSSAEPATIEPSGSLRLGPWGGAVHLVTVTDLPKGVEPHEAAGLLATRALDRGIRVDLTENGYLILEHDGVCHRFKEEWTTLTHRLARDCTRNKDITSSLLRSRDVSTARNVLFEPHEVVRAWGWAQPDLPVVVKPHNASKGQGVNTGISNEAAFRQAFEAVASSHGLVLVEQTLPGEEHRFATVGTSVIAVARRVPMHVIGDGESSIGQLIEAKNIERGRRGNPVHKLLQVDDAVHGTLSRHGLTLQHIPAEGAMTLLRDVSNVSLGGDAVDVTDEVAEQHVSLVTRAAQAIPGLGCAGFDVMIDGDDAAVLEVNPAPMLSMHHYPWVGTPRDAYSEVLNAMFPTSSPSSHRRR